MATVLWNLAGRPDTGERAHPFNDVSENAWYTDGITWAATHGIASGYGDGIFAPDDNITREQMAVILFNYATAMNLPLPRVRVGGFADDTSISPWARQAVNALFEAGIINGMPDGSGGIIFASQNGATRPEVAMLLMNFINAIP